MNGAVVVATKKIRFFPHKPEAYHQAIALYRRCFNLCVEWFKAGKHKVNGQYVDLRPALRRLVEQEQREAGRIYNNELPNEAYRDARNCLDAVIKKNKAAKGSGQTNFSDLGFKSRKGSRHTFNFPKFPTGKNIAVKALGKVFLTEEAPAECFMKACKVTRDKGRWFLLVKQHIPVRPESQGAVRCVALDPGVRTFMTAFSPEDAAIYGERFAQHRLYPLMKQVDRLLSRKQKVLNAVKGVDVWPQWATDTLRHVNRRLDRLKCRKDDILLDLHNRVAYDLVHRYDVIFLPTFETRHMVRRRGAKVRTIRRNTARQMLDLKHYRFKMRLKWYARKYGKTVVDTNEAYTSKTRSWDGEIVQSLGGAKVIKGEGFTVDRDINGARNGLIKQLSRAA